MTGVGWSSFIRQQGTLWLRSRLIWGQLRLSGFEAFPFPGLHLSNALGHRQVFRHGAAQFVDRPPHFAPDLMVDAIGGVLLAHVFPAQFSSVWVARNRFAASSVLPMWSRICCLGFSRLRS